MPDLDVLNRSVTRDDYPQSPTAGVLRFYLSPWPNLASTAPDLPPYWSMQRDAILLGTIYRESIWSSAVAKAIGKETSKSFKVDSDVPLRAKRAQELFISFDSNRGWVGGLAKHLQSYLLTGNGGFVEIVRATAAAGGRILGLVPLDTLRCLRTGDAAIPVIYRDRRGNEHQMKDYQVFMLSDMPDQSELWYGVGHCAAERAYNKVLTLAGLEQYLLEKITGRTPTEVHIVNGLKTDTIQGVIHTAQEDAQRKGLANYMGAAIAGIIDPGATPALVTIPLKSVPDGFDAEKERAEGKLAYADALGLDPQDLDPRLISRGALGGAQSVVLEEKAKGIEQWPKDWTHAVNENALDDRTTFTFFERDLRDEKAQAEVFNLNAAGNEILINTGQITPPQGTQLLVDKDLLPKEFLPVDATPDEELSDEEKPEAEEEQTAPVSEAAPVPQVPAQATEPAVTSKEVSIFVADQIERLQAQMEMRLAQSKNGEQERMAAMRDQLSVISALVAALKEIPTEPPAPPVVTMPEVVIKQQPEVNIDLAPLVATLENHLKQFAQPPDVYLPPMDWAPLVAVLQQLAAALARPVQVETPVVVQPTFNVPAAQVTAEVHMPAMRTTSIVQRDALGRTAGLEGIMKPIKEGE